MTPLKDVVLLSSPVVSVALLAPLFVTVPPAPPTSESDPIVLLKPLRSSVAPRLTAKAEFCERPVADPAASVPASTVVVPEYVLLPDSVIVPLPVLVSASTPAPSCRLPLNDVVLLSPAALA